MGRHCGVVARAFDGAVIGCHQPRFPDVDTEVPHARRHVHLVARFYPYRLEFLNDVWHRKVGEFLLEDYSLAGKHPVGLIELIHVVVAIGLDVLAVYGAALPHRDVPLVLSTADHVVVNNRARCLGIHQNLSHLLVGPRRVWFKHILTIPQLLL